MARIVSFAVLVVILLVMSALFLWVMADFILPIFLALLLFVMFGPAYGCRFACGCSSSTIGRWRLFC